MHPALWVLLGLVVGVIGMALALRSLTRRTEARAREAERRARRSERLAELGSMTGGLAHEIKNPLSTISLNAQLLSEAVKEVEMPPEPRDRLRRRIDALVREVDRLRTILTDFLQFAGRVKLDPQSHDLVRVVDELSDFFHPQCDRAGVVLRTRLPGDPVMVRIDEGLFKQALLNLMINAVQAMTGTPGGSSAAGAEPGSNAPAARRPELIVQVEPTADEARVQVIDTGPGIDAEQLEEIFHPYVSRISGGTGLGLPTARRIVEEHGGRLTAHSEPGRGSSFVISLKRD